MSKISCKNTVAILSAVFFFLLSLGGCKDPIIKDRSLVNGPDDLLNLDFVDTFTVWTKTINEDPYPSDISSYGVLGSMNDHIFGKTVCGFYAQCRLTQSGLLFGANPLVDSVVFSIVSEDKYGKVYNVGNGKSYSVLELANIISNDKVHIDARLGESRETLSDASNLRSTFGWSPTVSLTDWLTKQLKS
jgi:hypothetical protein